MTARPPAGRIAYVGRHFPQWTEVKRALADWSVENLVAPDLRSTFDAAARAMVELVIVGPSDGYCGVHEICAEVRRLGYLGTILLLTASEDVVERILGLESGADVWFAADADTRSTVAQIRALIRRSRASEAQDPSTNLRAGRFVLNAATREVMVGTDLFDLTTLEFELLWVLASNAGDSLSREQLATMLGYEGLALEGRAVDTAIGRLRRHLGYPHAAQIRTIRGVGYMLCTHSMSDRGVYFPSGNVSQ